MPPATPISTSCSTLPMELFDDIISELWSSSLYKDERINFMTTSRLVGEVWTDAFIRVAFKDVYIPCESYLRHYKNLCKQPAFKHHEDSLPLGRLCRTITFHEASAHPHPFDSRIFADLVLVIGASFTEITEIMDIVEHLPNIQTLRLQYPSFRDNNFIEFYLPLARLNLKYSFTAPTPLWIIEVLSQDEEQHQNTPWSLPFVHHISIHGVDEDLVVGDILLACPTLKEVGICPIHIELQGPSAEASSQIIIHQPLPFATVKHVKKVEDGYELHIEAVCICVELPSRGVPVCGRVNRTVNMFQRRRCP